MILWENLTNPNWLKKESIKSILSIENTILRKKFSYIFSCSLFSSIHICCGGLWFLSHLKNGINKLTSGTLYIPFWRPSQWVYRLQFLPKSTPGDKGKEQWPCPPLATPLARNCLILSKLAQHFKRIYKRPCMFFEFIHIKTVSTYGKHTYVEWFIYQQE